MKDEAMTADAPEQQPDTLAEGLEVDEDYGHLKPSIYSPANARLVLIDTLLGYREPMQELADDVKHARPCEVPSWAAMDAIRSLTPHAEATRQIEALRAELSLLRDSYAGLNRDGSMALRLKDAAEAEAAGLRAVLGRVQTMAETAAYNAQQGGITLDNADLVRLLEDIARQALAQTKRRP